MAANPSPSSALPRSTHAIASPPSCGRERCRRCWSLAHADDKSARVLARARTTRLRCAFSLAANPLAGGENRASANADACALFLTNLACKLGSFFSQRIGHFAQLLGHVEAIDHRLAVLQQRPAR